MKKHDESLSHKRFCDGHSRGQALCSVHQDPFNGLLNPDDYEKGPGAKDGAGFNESRLDFLESTCQGLEEAWERAKPAGSLGPLVPPVRSFLQGTVTVKDKLAKLGKQNNPHWACGLIETSLMPC